jgi:light-regulated signal transduction histidine kinase (bacteriophytochrome)
VIAEEKEEGMDVYMGLKFPASDVPKQARELYRRNPYRLIPNVDYQPIKLYPVINPLTHAFTDLTDSNLRSVVPVHLEYLRNMKVSASMSTRILKDGVLWGLIACHHRTPKYLSYQMCSVFELLSHIISAKISSLTNTDTHLYKSEMQHLLTRVMESVYKTGSLTVGLLTQEEALLKLLSGGGMALSLNRQVETIGAAPNSEDVRNLVFWLQTNGINKTYQHTNLSSAYEDAEEYVAQGSGLLALPIQPEKGDYILVFRPEVIQQTNWGGNPNEAVQFEPDRKTYHPRNSFQLWKETVSKTAMPWTETEVDVAESFRSLVMEYTLNKV